MRWVAISEGDGFIDGVLVVLVVVMVLLDGIYTLLGVGDGGHGWRW